MNCPLPGDWRQALAFASREQVLELLPLVERFAMAETDAYTALLPLATQKDFAVRLRTLLALRRLQQGAAFLPLLALLEQETATHWRLALLETLLALPYEDKITPLLPLLAKDMPGDGGAFFLCGLVWFLGQQGEAAIAPLTEHLLAQPARARRVKDGLLAEAFFLAAGGNKQLLHRLAAQSPPLYRFCNNRIWPRGIQPHYGIYPHPDYLLQIALQNGITQGQFKRLYYRHRDKAGRAAPPI